MSVWPLVLSSLIKIITALMRGMNFSVCLVWFWGFFPQRHHTRKNHKYFSENMLTSSQFISLPKWKCTYITMKYYCFEVYQFKSIRKQCINKHKDEVASEEMQHLTYYPHFLFDNEQEALRTVHHHSGHKGQAQSLSFGSEKMFSVTFLFWLKDGWDESPRAFIGISSPSGNCMCCGYVDKCFYNSL